MKKYLLSFLLIGSLLFAQGSAGQSAKFEYRSLIDLPTAGILEKGFVGVSMDLMPLGTVVSKIEVGVFDNFSFGISYGGANILGSGAIKWYNLPGVNARVRVMDETNQYPALTIGFDSQGKGEFLKSTNRYMIKSPGFFLAAAKNFEFWGFLSVHGVINYSLERDDNDKDINLGLGVEKTIGDKISVMMEYDFAVNDNNTISFGDGSGYLNFGARWTIGQGFTLGFNLRDLLDNKKVYSAKADRGIFLEYVKAIF